MPPVQLQVDWLHVFPTSQPPQSDLQTQLQASGFALYVGPQLSAAVSQTQPHVPPLFWNVYPVGHDAAWRQLHVQLGTSHTWNWLHDPAQSLVHTKSQTSLFVSQTLPGGGAPPQSVGQTQVLVVRSHASRPRQKSGSVGS